METRLIIFRFVKAVNFFSLSSKHIYDEKKYFLNSQRLKAETDFDFEMHHTSVKSKMAEPLHGKYG